MLDGLIRAAAAAPVAPPEEQWDVAASPGAGSASLLAALNLSSATSIAALQLPADMQEDAQVRARPALRRLTSSGGGTG